MNENFPQKTSQKDQKSTTKWRVLLMHFLSHKDVETII